MSRLFLILISVAVVMSTSLKSVTDENPIKSAKQLRRAFNAALARIIDSGEFLNIKNRTGMNEVIACITCAPDPSQSVFPAKDALEGRLADIIKTKEIIVAGLRYIDMPSGNYVVDPPIGFWPEYLRAIVEKVGTFYGVQLSIKWNLFSSSMAIMDSVRNGESDMTDLYMILSSFYEGKDRTEAFSMTCSPGGYESTLTARRDSKINSIVTLNSALKSGTLVKIGALSTADFMTVKPFLDARAVPVTFESVDELRRKILSNEILAGVTSSNPGDTTDLVTFRSGVVSPRAAMMLLDTDEKLAPKEKSDLVMWIIIGAISLVVIFIIGIIIGCACKKSKKTEIPATVAI